MRREGRQHGMVLTCSSKFGWHQGRARGWNPEWGRDPHVNNIDSPLTAGKFIKVSTKPTNHSKFTNKCVLARCRYDCYMYPRSKAKDKTKGSQKLKASNVLLNYRLDGHLNPSGFSTSEILDNLSGDYFSDDEDDDEIDDYDGSVDDQTVDIEGDGNDYEVLGFFNVEHVIDNQIEEDEGWCLVPQTQT